MASTSLGIAGSTSGNNHIGTIRGRGGLPRNACAFSTCVCASKGAVPNNNTRVFTRICSSGNGCICDGLVRGAGTAGN